MNNTRRGFIGSLLAAPAIGIAALFKSKPEYKDTPAEIAAQERYKQHLANYRDEMCVIYPSHALKINHGSFQIGNRTVKLMTDENGNDILVLAK